MKKKIIWIIVATLFIILFVLIVKPIRTKSVMESIAINEFEDVKIYDSLRKQLIGPVIIDKGLYREFKWYKVLEWGDTSAIYIDVYKKPTSFSWRDDFFFPRVTMNYRWYYFIFPNGTSKFEDILPNIQEKTPIDVSKFKLFSKQIEIADSIQFIVNPSRLLYFLQKGYFTVVEKKDNYSIVEFYEPIANVVHEHTMDTISTMSAKIFVTDSTEVHIIPYGASER